MDDQPNRGLPRRGNAAPAFRRLAPSALLLLLLLTTAGARAEDIEGVQPAALDQPRVYVLLRREPQGRPLEAKQGAGAGLLDLLGLGDEEHPRRAAPAGGK